MFRQLQGRALNYGGNRLFFPDSPTNAWFLTLDERAKAVERIKVSLSRVFATFSLILSKDNQTGIENKNFKFEQ